MLKYIFGFLLSSIVSFSFADKSDKSGDGDSKSGENDDKGAKDDEKDTDSKDKDKGEDDKAGEGPDDKPEKTHTEKEVNAAAAQGRKGAEAKFLKKLGVDNVEDIETKLKKLSEVEDADNSDLENANKALEKLTKQFGDQGEQVKTLLSRLLSSAVKAEALDPKYGINPKVVNDLWKLIKNDESIVEHLEIDEDTFKVTGIDKAIKAAIKGRDYMLLDEDDPKKQKGSPPRTPPRKGSDNSKGPVKAKRAPTL